MCSKKMYETTLNSVVIEGLITSGHCWSWLPELNVSVGWVVVTELIIKGGCAKAFGVR